jgi:hypothetical protein
MSYGQRTMPQRRFSPGTVGGLDGPWGPQSAEHAGVLILTHGEFADEAAAQLGHRRSTNMQHAMLSANAFSG